MFRVIHIFYTYVTSVSSGRCKSRSRCCICCYAYTCMFQMFYLFQTYMMQMFHLNISKVDRVLHVAAGGCHCCWAQPCVNPRGFPVRGPGWAWVLLRTRALVLGWDAGRGAWGRMWTQELHRCGSRVRTRRPVPEHLSGRYAFRLLCQGRRTGDNFIMMTALDTR
jgi:hypothetical protein